MKKGIYIYYVILLGVLFTWTSPDLPPMFLRLVYFLFVVSPVLFIKKSLFPCILSTFVILSANRYFPSYMPFMPMYLAIASFVGLFSGKNGHIVRPSIVLWVLLFFTLIVDIGRSSSVDTLSVTILVIVLFYYYIDEDTAHRGEDLSISFVVISTALCIEMLLHREDITYSILVGSDDYDRIGWSDPNYFTGLVGMGALSAMNLLLFNDGLKRHWRYLLYAAVFLIVVVSLMVASRGGIVAMVAGAIVLITLSRKRGKSASKLFFVLLLFGVFLYSSGLIDFLLARFFNDSGEIGGRRVIWTNKLAVFSAEASPLDWIIGIGHKKASQLSSSLGNRSVIGFHNDYLAFLLSYGIIGLFLLLTLFVLPIYKYKDARVTAGIVYLMVISWTLEPLSNGMLDFFYFYFYLCVLGIWKKNKSSSQITSGSL